MSTEHENRRQHFRVTYPVGCRPDLYISGNSCEVLDISEKGIRFRCDEDPGLTAGEHIKGNMVMNSGEAVDIKGEILRTGKNTTIVKLSEEIPFKTILDEQIFIKNNYPEFYNSE